MRILGAEFQKVKSWDRGGGAGQPGHSGGIEALGEGVIDVGLAGRGLKPDEIAKGVREAACMTTALVFAANHDDQGAASEVPNCPPCSGTHGRPGRTAHR